MLFLSTKSDKEDGKLNSYFQDLGTPIVRTVLNSIVFLFKGTKHYQFSGSNFFLNS